MIFSFLWPSRLILLVVFVLLILPLPSCTFKEGYGGRMITPEFKKTAQKLNLSHQPAKNEIPYESGSVTLIAIEGTEIRQVVGADTTEIAVVIEMKSPITAPPLATEPIIKALKLVTHKTTCRFSGPYASGQVWLNSPSHSLKPGATGSFRATATCNGIGHFDSDGEMQVLGVKHVIKNVK